MLFCEVQICLFICREQPGFVLLYQLFGRIRLVKITRAFVFPAVDLLKINESHTQFDKGYLMTSKGYRILTFTSKGEAAARPIVHTGSGYDNTVVTMEIRHVLRY